MSLRLASTSIPHSARAIAGPSTLTSPSARFVSSSSSSPPTHYYITLLRSSIGLPLSSRETLSALGFGYGHHEKNQSHKLHRSVVHPFSSTTAGQILRVKELVKVRNVTMEEGERLLYEERWGRKEPRGFEVVGKRVGGGKVEETSLA